MPESDFERLLRENEADLAIIRQTYLPLITNKTITGYNLYPEQLDYSKAPYFLNYLHSDLKPDDKHLDEVLAFLKDNNVHNQLAVLNGRLVEGRKILTRDATYRSEPD